MTHESDAMKKPLTTQAPEPVNMGLAFDYSTHCLRCFINNHNTRGYK